MVYFQKMTPEGYKQIKDEIACLKKGRPRRIKILQAGCARRFQNMFPMKSLTNF